MKVLREFEHYIIIFLINLLEIKLQRQIFLTLANYEQILFVNNSKEDIIVVILN